MLGLTPLSTVRGLFHLTIQADMSYSPGTSTYSNPAITISSPLQPPPQQLSSADGTIQGGIDGRSAVFYWQVYFPQIQLWRNGVLQTNGVDYCAGPTSLKFLPGAIPVPGDILTLLGYGTL